MSAPVWRGAWGVLVGLLVLVALPSYGTDGFEPDFSAVEVDPRTVPWQTIHRLALENGHFPPLYYPVTEFELATLLVDTGDPDVSPIAIDTDELATANYWHHRYTSASAPLIGHGCPCKAHPLQWRLSGRLISGYSELGDVVPHEAGLAFSPGWSLSMEPQAGLAVGRFWLSVGGRVSGGLGSSGVRFGDTGNQNDPLTWPDWRIATGRNQVRHARLSNGVWTVGFPQAVVGAKLGNWSLSAGWAPRHVGPGFSGRLTLDSSGASLPAVTARRVQPFRWRGFMGWLAPDHLLMRTGLMSERTVTYRDEMEPRSFQSHPWFFEWLIGWDVLPWFRASFTHTAMATARQGTLWPDLLQINFPVIGTTRREARSGPITDRLFAAMFEFRWRNSPIPLLPAAAGRAYWEYAGTDFLPSGPGGLIPQISIPASVIGLELVSPRWDLAAEYSGISHDSTLWYSNGGFPEGYSQNQWLLGHALGGSGEQVLALVRVRPSTWPVGWEVQASRATWGHARFTPGDGKRHRVALSLQNRPDNSATGLWGFHRWTLTAQWNREEADPSAFSTEAGSAQVANRDWWQFSVKIEY